MPLPLSVIISTYNLARYQDTVDVLRSLANQSFNKFEVIVIIDENHQYYKKLQEFTRNIDLYNVRLVFNPFNNGLSYSRNLGIKYAKGEIVAYLDDDVIVSPNWAKEIFRTFRKYENVGAVAGHIIPLWMDKSIEWFPEELYWMISCSYILTPKKEREVDRGFGANMAFRRELLLELGGFREDLGLSGEKWVGGEDTDMFLRVKERSYKVIFNPKALVYHKIYPHRIKMRTLIKRALGGGRSIAKLKKNYMYVPEKENTYLNKLLYEFYISKGSQFLKSPNTEYIKQFGAVTLVVTFEGLGYLLESLERS
ncbi:MAG: glucosyl-dolichyl phosphate glucuronosyltransferase [Thermococcaceae archaeon]|nr:glucosyl-dolichyl phosphate glucuronosyltransferase [Thermococcaceae archaeon]